MYIPGTDIIEKLHGIGPNIITELMVDKWFKYNFGSKRFTNIPIKHFSIQCDAIIIYNEFWQKKLIMNMNKLH
jgi:calmodulin-regulated spectrin-associated protein